MGALDGAFIGASLGVGIAVAGAAIGEGATVGTAAYLGGSAAATDYFYGTYRAGQIEEGDDNEFAPLTKPASPAGDCGESFSSSTMVATPTGETPIGHLQVGDPVVAYDPQAKATSTQHVEHVFIDHDTDLLDITLHKDHPAKTVSTAADAQSSGSSKDEAANEVVHTTASHPWLTTESGWVRAGKLHVGERVVRADGSSAVVAALQVIPGAADVYDLTVSNKHTFAVGVGRYVVHNCGATGNGDGVPGDPDNYIGTYDKVRIHRGKGIVAQYTDPVGEKPWIEAKGAPPGRAMGQNFSKGFSRFLQEQYPGENPSGWSYRIARFVNPDTGEVVDDHYWYNTQHFGDYYHHHER